jgi:hypothetical protein
MEPHSGPSRYFSEEELSYLSRLAAAMQFQVEPKTVKMWPAKAPQDGLDPRELYEAVVATRLPQWDPAPPFEVVNPT